MPAGNEQVLSSAAPDPARPARTNVRQILNRLGLYRLDRRIKQRLGIKKYRMNFPPYGPEAQRAVSGTIDVVRHSSLALALHRLRVDQIPGEFAEVGVYQGDLSEFLASIAPERRLHLFDTFSGFASEDAESAHEAANDTRFRNTSMAAVRRRVEAFSTNVVFHQGWFPDTAVELGDETFAFVMLDMDKYKPTLAGLEVFYPRMQRGGYVFLHDYNSPESNYGIARALHEFLADKPELAIEFPDVGGSVAFRKI